MSGFCFPFPVTEELCELMAQMPYLFTGCQVLLEDHLLCRNRPDIPRDISVQVINGIDIDFFESGPRISISIRGRDEERANTYVYAPSSNRAKECPCPITHIILDSDHPLVATLVSHGGWQSTLLAMIPRKLVYGKSVEGRRLFNHDPCPDLIRKVAEESPHLLEGRFAFVATSQIGRPKPDKVTLHADNGEQLVMLTRYDAKRGGFSFVMIYARESGKVAVQGPGSASHFAYLPDQKDPTRFEKGRRYLTLLQLYHGDTILKEPSAEDGY